MKWLKEIAKQDIIGFLFLCFLVGFIFIWFTGAFVRFPLSAGEKINATVLWLTALAIFWYAYETYQLKKSTTEQVGIQEEAMLNAFLPILEPLMKGRGPVVKDGVVTKLCIRNLGRGPAKYITLSLGRVKIPIGMSIAGGEEASVQVSPLLRTELAKMLQARPERFPLTIGYQDIYGRRFSTDHIYLDKAPRRQDYYLRQGSWDFKRLTKP